MDWFTNEIRSLMASGLTGTIVRTILRPEKTWQRWIGQMVVGLSAAVFLGQIIGHFIIKIAGQDSASATYYAVGYIIGTEAERWIRLMQEKLSKQTGDNKS